MYVYMYVCMYTYVCMYLCMMYVCMYVCMCVCVCVHVCMCVCMYVCNYVCVYGAVFKGGGCALCHSHPPYISEIYFKDMSFHPLLFFIPQIRPPPPVYSPGMYVIAILLILL